MKRAGGSDEINILEYIDILSRRKTMIILIVAVSVAVTGIISFLSPKIYEARAVIIPAVNPQDQNNLSSIVTQLGLPSNQTASIAEIISLLRSNVLMERVIKKYDLMPVFFGDKAKEKKIWDGIRYLKNYIYSVRDNKREGIIELSLELKDPEAAASILTDILTELTDYMSSEARRVAETNRKYLESLIDKNADPLIKQNIYALIARQIEISMMAEVKENFAFKVLDPPKVPDRKIKPRIRMNIMIALVVSVFAGILLALLSEYVERIRKDIRSKGN